MSYRIANGYREKTVLDPVYLLLDEQSQTLAEFYDKDLRDRVCDLLNCPAQQQAKKETKQT